MKTYNCGQEQILIYIGVHDADIINNRQLTIIITKIVKNNAARGIFGNMH